MPLSWPVLLEIPSIWTKLSINWWVLLRRITTVQGYWQVWNSSGAHKNWLGIMLSNHQKVVGHVPPCTIYGGTPYFKLKGFSTAYQFQPRFHSIFTSLFILQLPRIELPTFSKIQLSKRKLEKLALNWKWS